MLKNEVIIKRKKSILQEKDKSIKKRKREREREREENDFLCIAFIREEIIRQQIIMANKLLMLSRDNIHLRLSHKRRTIKSPRKYGGAYQTRNEN